MKVVLATHNQGKIREFQKILSEIGWDIISVSELGDIQEPEETGRTFEENALQKARYYANITQFPVLADDSGIIYCKINPVFIQHDMQENMVMIKQIMKS